MHRPADGLTLPSLPPQRTDRIPKDIHVEPERFAAELISKLEGVLRQREAEEKLEERLKRVRLVGFKPTSFPARFPPPLQNRCSPPPLPPPPLLLCYQPPLC